MAPLSSSWLAEGMDDSHKDDLHRYLKAIRDAMLWKTEGLSEYDVRRPLTPTGTNLLGLLKHVASVAAGYFGDCFDRPFPEPLPWFDDDAEVNADMWSPPEESRQSVLDLWDKAWAHADATIEELPIDTRGEVSWWPEERRHPTLHTLLVHMVAEVNRHAGHADIVRELIDGGTGHRADNSNLPDEDESWWREYHDRLEAAARAAQG